MRLIITQISRRRKTIDRRYYNICTHKLSDSSTGQVHYQDVKNSCSISVNRSSIAETEENVKVEWDLFVDIYLHRSDQHRWASRSSARDQLQRPMTVAWWSPEEEEQAETCAQGDKWVRRVSVVELWDEQQGQVVRSDWQSLWTSVPLMTVAGIYLDHWCAWTRHYSMLCHWYLFSSTGAVRHHPDLIERKSERFRCDYSMYLHRHRFRVQEHRASIFAPAVLDSSMACWTYHSVDLEWRWCFVNECSHSDVDDE